MTRTTMILACLLISACARVGKSRPEVCPEYTNLLCLTDIDCDWDEARGCNVCACHNEPSDEEPLHPTPRYMPPGSKGPPGE